MNVIKAASMYQLQLSFMWASSDGGTLWQSGLGQWSDEMPSNENDQIPDDVDVLCIPIQAQKMTSVCCCPAALSYMFDFISLSGFSWFCPRQCLLWLPSLYRVDQRFCSLAQHLSAICSIHCVVHHLYKQVNVNRCCHEEKCSPTIMDFSHQIKSGHWN